MQQKIFYKELTLSPPIKDRLQLPQIHSHPTNSNQHSAKETILV